MVTDTGGLHGELQGPSGETLTEFETLKLPAGSGGTEAKQMNRRPATTATRRMRLPSENCALCDRTIEQVGGYRLVGTHTRLVVLSGRHEGGGNPENPIISVRLRKDDEIYLLVRGVEWTSARIEKARNEYLADRRPWFCQVCGDRKCRECGSPLNMPWATDVLYDNGCSAHVPLVPCNPGCTNQACVRFREWPQPA